MVVSIVTALWTIVDVYWVLTTTGLFAYFIWNILMISADDTDLEGCQEMSSFI